MLHTHQAVADRPDVFARDLRHRVKRMDANGYVCECKSLTLDELAVMRGLAGL